MMKTSADNKTATRDAGGIAEMKERVCTANIRLRQAGLVLLTWGNVSEVNRDLGVIVIKPSGVDYDSMTPQEMVVTDLEGRLLDGHSLRPSSDLPTHVVLYHDFADIGAVVHTHSTHAAMWAQSGRDIPPYGTTHADTFYGGVPVTRQLSQEEIERAYEAETGRVITETFTEKNLDPMAVPGALVRSHGPFTWGHTPEEAVENSIILEEIAHMALGTEIISNHHEHISDYVLDKHYFRKHGKDAYYGQRQ